MSSGVSEILVVDDEDFNRELIAEYLDTAGYAHAAVENGEQALAILEESSDRFSAVLLDRMMPGINGLEVLKQIKNTEALKNLPVIMQTAKAGKENMLEGLAAGAHYYLTKPYDQETLVTIVRTAVRDYEQYRDLKHSVQESNRTLSLMSKGEFRYNTIEQGRNLATMLANACDEPDRVVLGLTELMINAVEHGNLGITYEEKSELNANGDLEAEIDIRLNMEEYSSKQVVVEFERRDSEIVFVISDEGDGFDWEQYLELSPERVFDSHGRGIAMAKSISFDSIEYKDRGNKVCMSVNCRQHGVQE